MTLVDYELAGKHGNRLHLDNKTRIFLYQMVGTWGQLLFPKPWKEFRLWYDENKTKGIKPFLQGMVTTGWYKRFGERIWTPWFIKFIHSRGYYNIYTNFDRERALSISHRDAGVNYGKTIGPDSRLLEEESLDFDLMRLPLLRDLKWYDFCFAEILPSRVAGSFDELRSIVGSMKQNKLVVISLYQTTEKIARNLICNLHKDGLLNVVFVSGDTELLVDLARRGYPVIDSNKLISSFGHDKSIDLRHEVDFVKEIWIKASIVQKCLELGYDTWLIEGNMIPSGGSLPELPNSSSNLAVAKDVELLFVKSCPSSLKIWNGEYVRRVATASKFLSANNSQPTRDDNFMHLVAMTLGEKDNVPLSRFDRSNIGSKLGDATLKPTEGKANIVFWDRQMTMASVQAELERFGMWLIDAESSCTSVVCHI